jgi:UDPglucose--hexose-1-phosphate uridylyltransferase
MIRQESATAERIVLESPHFLAFTPFASRFPFETWILPKAHDSHFENVQAHQVDDLGTFLKAILLKLEVALDRPAYNYMIHTAPLNSLPLSHYHWHIEIIPRLTRVAGFEWGTGFYINPVPPEHAAAFLRATVI